MLILREGDPKMFQYCLEDRKNFKSKMGGLQASYLKPLLCSSGSQHLGRPTKQNMQFGYTFSTILCGFNIRDPSVENHFSTVWYLLNMLFINLRFKLDYKQIN